MIARSAYRAAALVGTLVILLVVASSSSAAQGPLGSVKPDPTPKTTPPSAAAPAPKAPGKLVFITPAATGPVVTVPGGTTLAAGGAIMPSTTGNDLNYSGFDKTQFSALWWGPAAALAAGGIPAGLAFDGEAEGITGADPNPINPDPGEVMSFDATATNGAALAAGIEYWSGSAFNDAAVQVCQGGNPCNPCLVSAPCPTRLVISVTDPTGATPIPLVLASGVNGIPASAGAVAPITGNFKVNLKMQMQVPATSVWTDPKTWYDALPFLMAAKDLKMRSTFDGGFWYLPASFSQVKNQQYTLSNSDGATWVEIDPTNQVVVAPGFDQIAIVGGNVDLWTAKAGYNQDIAIFVSDNGGADALLAWKESGGFAGTFSPNAAFVQGVMPVTGGHYYIFKLKWKTNKPASGATIYAGAGPLLAPNPPQVSPTRLTAKLVPSSANATTTVVQNTQYHLQSSDGANWVAIDGTNLKFTLTPTADGTAVLGANVDLWTANAGYNQDIGIFVSDNAGADTIVGWKESGGFAGTFSPNAAYLQTMFAMTAGHTYVFTLKWKTNKPASGATIYAGAGPLLAPNPAQISPTSMTALVLPGVLNAATASVANTQYHLQNSDGATFVAIDATNLKVDITPAANTSAIVSANVDLWTATAGFNQDVAIFVAVDAGAPSLAAWKESGGFAGTFSPNAAFLQTTYAMTTGHTYHFFIYWKTNKVGSSNIYAGAGPLSAPNPPQISPARLTVQLTT